MLKVRKPTISGFRLPDETQAQVEHIARTVKIPVPSVARVLVIAALRKPPSLKDVALWHVAALGALSDEGQLGDDTIFGAAGSSDEHIA